jgi:hypothetical protein
MNWIALIGSVAKLFAEAVAALREWKLIAAAHARGAAERGEEMRQIAGKPPGRVEVDKRLEEGSA